MRVSVLVLGLALAVGCGGARPTPVTIGAATSAPIPEHVGFRASGHIERELESLRALDASDAPTRTRRYAREVELLADLVRCHDARVLAGEIATRGDEVAKHAASGATAECERLETKPTPDALAKMRAEFHDARRVEAGDPARAEKLYLEAWADAPSVASMLGVARAAKASGDAALAERSYERALGWAERGGEKASVAVTAGALAPKVEMRPVDVRGDEATYATGGFFLRQNLKSGAMHVLAAFPAGFDVAASNDRFALLVADPAQRTDPPRLFEIGIDDDATATPLDAFTGADELAISPDGAVAAARIGGAVTVVELATNKVLAKTTLPPGEATLVGLTIDHDVVARVPNLICVLSGPTYGACRADAALHTGAGYAFGARPVIAGRRIAFLDGLTTLRIYDVHEARSLHDFPGRFLRVYAIALSQDGGAFTTTSGTRGSYLWNAATGKYDVIGSLGGLDSPVFAGDKRLIVAHDLPSEHTARVYYEPGSILGAAGTLRDGPRVYAFGAPGALWVAGADVVSRVDVTRKSITTFVVDGDATGIAISPDESMIAVRLYGSNVIVYDPSGKRVAIGVMSDGPMRFEGRHVVVRGDANEEVLDLDTQKVTQRASAGAPAAPIESKVKDGEGGLIQLEDATLDLGNDAFVVTRNGKSTIGGDASSIGCRVGARWLPLETCRDRLLGPSPR